MEDDPKPTRELDVKVVVDILSINSARFEGVGLACSTLGREHLLRVPWRFMDLIHPNGNSLDQFVIFDPNSRFNLALYI